jgi:hypothetical protein
MTFAREVLALQLMKAALIQVCHCLMPLKPTCHSSSQEIKFIYLPPKASPTAGTPVSEEGTPTETPVEAKPTDAQEEVKKFIRWVRKGNSSRAFNFEALDPTYAEVLNKFVEAKDLDGARWYAERYLGL